jgi:predicted dehydrogenase
VIKFDAVVDTGPATGAPLAVPDYLPRPVTGAGHGIALVGCGGISALHLAAYRRAGYPVKVLCDHTYARALTRRDEYFPQARVTTAVTDVLADPAIDIVDLATHVRGRAELISASLRAGKHVLSQKPFVQNLAEGEALIALAAETGRTLAVNHNGRWAPHFAAALTSVERGDIGAVTSADFSVYWPHDAIVESDPAFATMTDLILYDFGIHWFDLVAQLMRDAGRAFRVYAATFTRKGSRIEVPTDADVIVEFEHGHAALRFRGSAERSESGSYRIEGTRGTISHCGLSLGGDTVDFQTANGNRLLQLEGDWWSNGMTGTMAELIAAVDEQRPARHDARTALAGTALCFAALRSVRDHQPVDPALVRAMPTP